MRVVRADVMPLHPLREFGGWGTDSGMAAGLLSSWLGFAVLLGYAIVFALIGGLTTLRHNIT